MDAAVTRNLRRPRYWILGLISVLIGSQQARAEWPEWVSSRYFQPAADAEGSGSQDDYVFRGQSDPFYAPPANGGIPATAIPPVAQAPVPGAAQLPGSTDPFVNGQFAAPPSTFDPYSPAPQGVYGINGPQPFRYGWKEMLEYAIVPATNTSPNVGDFGYSEINYLKEWNQAGPGGGVWTVSPQFNLRLVDGQSIPGVAPDLYRFGLGLKYSTSVNPGGVSWEFGFTPGFATDFKQNLNSDGWQFDAHLASFWRTSPTWMWVLGVFYWDRGEDIVLPYAGAVWTPSDYFEARLLFPKAKLEWFLGTPSNVATWFYVTGEYHVESYQVGFEPILPGPVTGSMQIEDWRILGGLRWETGASEIFLESGIVFAREVDFGFGSFDPDEQLMTRVGIKF